MLHLSDISDEQSKKSEAKKVTRAEDMAQWQSTCLPASGSGFYHCYHKTTTTIPKKQERKEKNPKPKKWQVQKTLKMPAI